VPSVSTIALKNTCDVPTICVRRDLAIVVLEGVLRLAMMETPHSTLFTQFVLVDRRTKIASGQRTTSFSWLLNDKRGVIGRTMSSVPEQFREAAFMLGQLCEFANTC
jgi:hypothetical protein